MLQWNIGAVTVTRIVELEVPVPYDPAHPFLPGATPERLREMPWLYPHFVTEEGHLKLSIHALVVRAPGLTLVVDTCVGNDKPRALMGGVALQTAFLESLAEAGCAPESVDAVVCTHLHVDHVGWNTMLRNGRWVPTFPNARYLFGRREYEACTREMENIGGTSHGLHPSVFIADSVKPVFDTGLADLVEADHRICAEVRLIPTHGHTPGHVSVLVESEGARALITGDSIHHPCQLRHTGWTLAADADRDAAAATRAALLDRHADTPTLFIGTHWAGRSCGYVERDGRSYRLNSTAAAS